MSYSLSHTYNLFKRYHDTTPKGSTLFDGATFLESYYIKRDKSSLDFEKWHIFLICFSWIGLKLISECSSYISELRSDTYRTLPLKKQYTWSNKVVSTIHALIVTLTALFILFIDDHNSTMWNDPIYLHSSLNEALLCFSMGYFIFDILELFFKRPNPDWYLFVIHHIVAITSFGIAVGYHRGTYWGVLLLLMEASTPSMNVRWYMAKLKKKGNNFYIWNGFLAAALFFVFRIILQLILFWHCYLHWHNLQRAEFFLVAIFFGEISVLFALNCFWFSLIVVRGLKNLKKSTDEMQKKQQ